VRAVGDQGERIDLPRLRQAGGHRFPPGRPAARGIDGKERSQRSPHQLIPPVRPRHEQEAAAFLDEVGQLLGPRALAREGIPEEDDRAEETPRLRTLRPSGENRVTEDPPPARKVLDKCRESE
jgi:hypothetical protein